MTNLTELQATTKQYFGLAGKFAYLLCEANEIPKEKYGIIRKRCLGVFHSQFPAQSLTKGKAQELFDQSEIPAFLNQKVKTEDMTKSPVKIKAVKKVTTKTKKVAKAKAEPVQVVPKVQITTESSDVDKRLTFIEGEISRQSEDILTIKSGLESILQVMKG